MVTFGLFTLIIFFSAHWFVSYILDRSNTSLQGKGTTRVERRLIKYNHSLHLFWQTYAKYDFFLRRIWYYKCIQRSELESGYGSMYTITRTDGESFVPLLRKTRLYKNDSKFDILIPWRKLMLEKRVNYHRRRKFFNIGGGGGRGQSQRRQLQYLGGGGGGGYCKMYIHACLVVI